MNQLQNNEVSVMTTKLLNGEEIFKDLINQNDLMLSLLNNGYKPELYSEQNKFLVTAKLDFILLLLNNNVLVHGMIQGIQMQEFEDVNVIYYLIDNGYRLNFRGIGKTIDEIKIMINKARVIEHDSLYHLCINGYLQELLNEHLVSILVTKGAWISLPNWDLLSSGVICIEHKEILNTITDLFDINRSFKNYLRGSITVEGVKYFLDRGADVNLRINEETIIILLCERGNKEIIDLLLDYGASIDMDMLLLSSPLIISLVERDYDLAEHLIRRGANATHALLMIAQTLINEEQIKFLIDHGANPYYILYNTKNTHDPVANELLEIGRYPNEIKSLMTRYNQ